MYAFTPEEILLQVVNVRPDIHFEMSEFTETVNHFPKDMCWTEHDAKMFRCIIYDEKYEFV